MTAEELLKQMSAEPFAEEMVCCVIDPETRVIDVPAEYQLLGVESDEKVERMYFQCPKIVGDNIDLSKLALRVNFRNANDQKDQYIVDDVEISGDNITFSWLLSRRVTQYKGNVSFIVCAVKASGEEITNEWNTTLATAQVLEGLEADITLPEEDTDVVKQLIAVATQKITDVQNATSSANTAASNADIKAQEAANAAEDARGVIDQITKDSYLHTTTQTFVDTVKASPTAYGNAIPEQIEGYIKQDTTKGLQLFDAKTVLSSQIQSKVLTCNNDGSVTLDGEITGSNRNFTIQLSAGTYYFNEKDKIFHTLVNGDDLWNKPYTFETDTTIKCYIANGEYGNKKIYPMINKGDSPLSIEPYTGRQPSPNPDYPQIVHGVGDMGFFDGELLQGYYQVSDGTFKPATVALCNKNPIPCKPGDKIIFEYEDVINGSGISIFFYKSDGTFISRVNKVGVRKIEGVAPQDTTYCNIVINPVSEPIPVASAKHITVTINDKYAVCVKSKGKNLLDFEGFLNSRGSQYTKCGDRYRITGTGSAYSNPILLSDEDEDFTLTGSVTSESGNGYSVQLLNNAGNVVAFIRDDTKKASGKGCKIRLNYVGAGAGVYEDIMVEKGTSHDKYIPCQSTTTYIPVDYPLFEGDKIVRSNGEYKLLRKWKQEVFDGSEDEGWVQGKSNTNQFYTSQYKEKKVNADIVSNRFKHAISVEPPSIWIGNDINIYFESGYLDNNTIAGFQEWLQENPVSCVYELATPTEEPLSSEAMKALYSIMACDEQTEIEIAGVPSDAEIQNQFLLPRNEDGALNTTAYCTAKRNEIALEELENATDARLSALETQALQEV